MTDQGSQVGDGALPQDFWAAPTTFIEDTALRLLHAEVSSRLRNENPDADTLELMCMERVASLYFFMRDRELNGTFSGTSSASYKSILQLWVGMAADLRKSRVSSTDEAMIRAEVSAEVIGAVKDSLRGMEPEVAVTLTRRIREKLGA